MAVTSGFFNAINKDRSYNAEQMSTIFDGIIRDGIFASIGTCLVVHASTGLTVTVGIGKAWFNHTWTLNDALLPLTADLSHVLLDRVDAVILEVNNTESVRGNTIKFIKGTASSTPVLPTLVNTEHVHQYVLAYVYRPANSTTITAVNITNMVGTVQTPFITGVLDVISVDELIGQWRAELDLFIDNEEADFTTWYNGMKDTMEDVAAELNIWTAAQQAEILAWFNNMKGQLTTDAATNLQLQINELEEDKTIFTPPNKILAMPTKPTYSGLVITVYAGTKVSMPNGRNADGTIKNTIFTLTTNTTFTAVIGSPRILFLRQSNGLISVAKDTFYTCDFTNRPTTVPSSNYYFMYCPDTNLHYYTAGNVNTNWQVDSKRVMLGEIYTNTTVITSLKINDVYNAGQEIDKINTKLAEDEAIFTPPNKILAMPTKPTYSGLVITVYAGTKVSIPNGRNADGTVNNIILTLATNVTQIMGTNRLYTVLLFANSVLSQHYASNYLYIDTLSDRPTTVAATSRYYCYCIETNLWYTTSGSLTASWNVSGMCPLGIANMTTVVTALKINGVYNAGQEVDKINTKLDAVEGVLAIGATSITLTDARLTANSNIIPMTSIWGVNPLTITKNVGNVVMTFPAQTVAITVGVEIHG